MKINKLLCLLLVLNSLVLKAALFSLSEPSIQIWQEKLNKTLSKRCSDLEFSLQLSPSGGSLRFFLYKKDVEDFVAKVAVEMSQELKLLVLYSNTKKEHQRKHYNLFLRAAVFHFFITQNKTPNYKIASDIANPASEIALRKYFNVDSKEDSTVYLNLSLDNLKKAAAILKKYPDC